MRVRDLAFVDSALERARERSAAMLQALRKRRRKRRAPASASVEDFERKKSKLGRAIEKLEAEKILRDWRRDRSARVASETMGGAQLRQAIEAAELIEGKC